MRGQAVDDVGTEHVERTIRPTDEENIGKGMCVGGPLYARGSCCIDV